MTGNVNFYANYTETVNKYLITFVDDDGTTELYKEEVAYGQTPVYGGNAPTKASTAQYTYTFAGWDADIAAVTGIATYTATYDSTVRKYSYTFYGDDGETILKDATVDYGTAITAPASDPVKDATAQYTYAFAGWYDALTGGNKVTEFGNATDTFTFYARFTATVNKYLISFYAEDGVELVWSAQFDYGETPVYGGPEQTKNADPQFTYTFAGWIPELVPVTGAKSYKATFSSTTNEYTVTWKNGEETLKTEKVPYGTTPKYTGNDPTREEDEGHTYTFKGWTPAVTAVNGDAIYTAVFQENVKQYSFTFYGDDGTTVIKTSTVDYGSEIEVPSDPVKDATDQYTYAFDGWYDALTGGNKVTVFGNVTGEVKYYARYTSTVNKYLVNFYAEDGVELVWSAQFDYGETPVYGGPEQTKKSDPQYSYTFAGWIPELVPVTGAKSYKATFTKTINKYDVTFVYVDANSQEHQIGETQSVEYGGAAIAPDTTRDGYIFTGWDVAFNSITGDLKVTASYVDASSPLIIVSNESGAAGSTVQVSIDLANNPGVAGIKVTVEYNESLLTLVQNERYDEGEEQYFYDWVSYVTPFAANGTQPSKGTSPIYIVWARTNNVTKVNATFATLTFRIANNAQAGTVIPINLTYTAGNISNQDKVDVNPTVINGSVTVTA